MISMQIVKMLKQIKYMKLYLKRIQINYVYEGKHIIYPKSCYLFAQKEYTNDTNDNQEQNIFE